MSAFPWKSAYPNLCFRESTPQKLSLVNTEFDPIQPIKNREKSYEDMLANLLKRGEEEEGVEKEGRRYIFWRKDKDSKITLRTVHGKDKGEGQNSSLLAPQLFSLVGKHRRRDYYPVL